MSTKTNIGTGAAEGVRAEIGSETLSPYSPVRPLGPIDLFLDANEGTASGVDIGATLARIGAEAARRYPNAAGLEAAIARLLGLPARGVLMTAGGDEAIDRACRAFLGPGNELILPVPTFEMIGRYARLAGAEVVGVPWSSGPFPIDEVLGRLNVRTTMIAVVSPNNPTGAVARPSDLTRLSKAAPSALLLVDLAYTEYADEDLTQAALSLPNAVIIRTFSKAYGLAGMRVGYAAGGERVVHAMRAAGSPYPVTGLSLAVAEEALAGAPARLPRRVARVRDERDRLRELLCELGARPVESQANFVLAEFRDAEWVWRALAGLGIGVRRFAEGLGLERSLRITCPGDDVGFVRLCHGLKAAMRPRALLLDMDGVIADVSRSYRRAIAMTADSFGVSVSPEAIGAAKADGNANNDWVLTHRLVTRAGVAATLEEVTARFELVYQGTVETPGLEVAESLIPEPVLLWRLAGRIRLGIVTGRPRRDCERFLRRFGLDKFFKAVVCMEDAPRKPDPAPIRLALQHLGTQSAWMIGDTPDDIVAARAAGVVPIGIAAPGDDRPVQRAS